jgi:uncharacterized protein (TIGR00369 family)
MSLTGNGDWQFVPAELDEVLSSKGHNALLGHRYNAHSPEWLELAMPWQEGLVGDRASGAFAAGPMMALMDNATGVSIWLRRGGYLPQVTVDLRVDHLRPPQRGAALICRCECYKLTPKLGYSRGFAYETSPDDPVAHVAATYMLL